MRIFRDIILRLFAICVVAVGIIIILGVAGIINVNTLVSTVMATLSENVLVSIIVSAVVSIIGIIAIFTKVDSGDDFKAGIAIKREQGNVYISKETFYHYHSVPVELEAELRIPAKRCKSNILFELFRWIHELCSKCHIQFVLFGFHH